ncbi:MAG TPA: flagellar protein FlaG [Bryobacteraceae bacterium]|nr:flagellar protein FlaG [Bryobacteraceae bacterium]
MQIDPLNSLNGVSGAAAVRNEDQTIPKQLTTAVRALNQSGMYGQDRQLQFARDPDTKTFVIKVVQPSTGEVMDQIPPETVLEAFKALQQVQAKETGA